MSVTKPQYVHARVFDAAKGKAVEENVLVPPGVDFTRASAARMYDYYLGGSNNFNVDREAAQKVIEMTPAVGAAKANRAFLRRAVQFLVAQGVHQFLDLGSGLPTVGNVHEIAQKANPHCRVVYVDNEPVAVAHAELLLKDNPLTAVIQADLRKPGNILKNPKVRALIDFDQPLGLLMMAVLHFVSDDDNPLGLIGHYRDALAPGSYLALSHATNDSPEHQLTAVANIYQNTQNQLYLRTHAEATALFTGFELVDPGVVYTPLWHPEHTSELPEDATRALIYGGVGRKVPTLIP